jgi:transcriptional regulator with XRE-family HTH domain
MSENVTLRESVAEEIRVLLARRMMSASELGRRVGMTQPYISRRLTGETAFDIDDLAKIADALGVEVAELLPRPNEGRLVTTSRHRETSPREINDRKATLTGRTRPIGGPANPIPRQATRRPARLPLAMTGS